MKNLKERKIKVFKIERKFWTYELKEGKKNSFQRKKERKKERKKKWVTNEWDRESVKERSVRKKAGFP